MTLKGLFETYATISIGDLDKVDFSQVGQTSKDTVRKNILEPPTQFILKWNTEPTFITDGTIIPDGLYTHEECLALMTTNTWSEPYPE